LSLPELVVASLVIAGEWFSPFDCVQSAIKRADKNLGKDSSSLHKVSRRLDHFPGWSLSFQRADDTVRKRAASAMRDIGTDLVHCHSEENSGATA
jgi:hypothetical protein